MHTTTYRDKTTIINFHHNGDYSGNVIIQHNDKDTELEIPFESLKFVVGEYIRKMEISRIEDSSINDLLGIFD